MDPTSIPPATNATPFHPFPAVAPPSTVVPFPPVSVPVPSPVPASAPVPAPAPVEANNHVTPAANANLSAASAPAPRHPPYADMIFSAIGALKEKNGSSKRAIGKYIEQVYRDLPPTHSSLLTHNLKRMKDGGELVMVKKSYKLPRSDGSAPTPPRGRGRPPKLKPQPQPQLQLQDQPQLQSQPQLGDLLFPQPVPQILPVQNAEPVWAALGLGDEPVEVKRGPGRPRKSGVGVEGSMSQAVPAGRRGRPPGSKNRPGRPRLSKRPGRPPKPKSLSTISNGLKRRPGRPPKIQSKPTVIPFAPPVSALPPGETVPAVQPTVPTATTPTATIPVVSPRPRGRPRKNAAAMPAYGADPRAVSGVGRGRGRGRGRGVGRPPKSAVAGRPKIPGARPVGRPKKGMTAAAASGNAVNDDLRAKLEYFQSKVKESLDVLKRQFNHESPVTAIAAIQDLEILSTMDLNAPLRDETQQEQQQQLPQHQLPPQQHLFAQPQQVLQHQSFLQPQHAPQQPQFYLQEMAQVQLQPQPQPQQLFQPHGSAPS